MTRKNIKAMIMALMEEADYDLAKSLDPEMAEEPEYAKEKLKRLIDIAQQHLTKVGQ
jgi:hypothetical protein